MIDLVVNPDLNLDVIPNKEFNRENFGFMLEMRELDALYDLFEPYLCNGWSMLSENDLASLGYLTSAWVLADDCTRNDEGELTWIGNQYYHERYMYDSAIEFLLNGATLTLKKLV